jgi:6-phosphogluconolactonase
VNRTTALDGIPGTGGGVVAFAIDRADGSLRHLNTRPSWGAMPIGVRIDGTNSRVIVGNHGAVSRVVLVRERDGAPVIERPTDDGTVALYPVEPDGSLGPVADVHVFDEPPVAGSEGLRPEAIGPTAGVQIGPACHQVAFDRTERWIIATDNGYDHIYVYPFSPASRTLEGRAFPAPPGAAPRHIAVHQRAPYFFVTNEREPSVSSYRLDPDTGEVELVQTIATLAEGDASPSNIGLHPNGRFLYSSNRGRGSNDTFAIFAVDEGTGRLRRVDVVEAGGRGQREFNIEPSGRYLFACNTQSGEVITFALNADTGGMTRSAQVSVERPMVIDFAML